MLKTLAYAALLVGGMYVLFRYGVPLPHGRGDAETFLTIGLALAGLNALFLLRD